MFLFVFYVCSSYLAGLNLNAERGDSPDMNITNYEHL